MEPARPERSLVADAPPSKRKELSRTPLCFHDWPPCAWPAWRAWPRNSWPANQCARLDIRGLRPNIAAEALARLKAHDWPGSLLDAGNLKFDARGRLDRVNHLENTLFEPAKLSPVVRAQNQEGDGSNRPVLLIRNPLVARDRQIEAGRFRFRDQVPVLQFRPAFFVGDLNLMSAQSIPKRRGDIVIQQDAHQAVTRPRARPNCGQRVRVRRSPVRARRLGTTPEIPRR